MHVDSYLEIFTTLYGWAFANIIGEVLVGLGLFALPFLVLPFQIWRDAKESAAAGASAEGLSEAIQVKIIIALFVFVFAFCTTPFTTLVNLSYTPVATASNPNPATATVGNTGTTYDQAMPQVSSISPNTGTLSSAPMWWYLVMALSSGLNDSVRAGITSAYTDLSDVLALGRLATVNDPALKADINRFYTECYLPARSQYLRMDKNTLDAGSQAIIDPSNKDYGPTDVDWMGSQLFVSDSHFYPAIHSRRPVVQFPATADEPNNANVGGGDITGTTSAYGWPTCLQWWSDPANGIRARIAGQSSSTIQRLSTALTNVFTGSSADEQQDLIARAATVNSPPAIVDAAHIMGSNESTVTNALHTVNGSIGTVFTWGTQAATSMAFMHMVAALPMIQALILLAIYTMLPLIVVLSGYKLEVMFYGAMGIFTVKFWTILWFIAQWLNAYLYQSMYPNQGIAVMGQEIANGALYKGTILNILLFGMYVVFPMIWSGMMSWIGVHLGNALSGIMAKNAHPAKNNTGMSAPGMNVVNKKF
jgi:hypothetical protein